MILGQESEVGKWTCPTCGNIYNVFISPSPDPSEVSLSCECGERIVWGHGGADYTKARVGRGNPDDTAANPRFPGATPDAGGIGGNDATPHRGPRDLP